MDRRRFAAIIPAACRLKRFADGVGGNAFIEYALLLALLLGGGIVAYYSVGHVTRDLVGEVAMFLGADAPARKPSPARSVSAKQRIADSQATQPTDRPRTDLTGWYASLSLGIILWWILRSRRRANSRRQPDQKDPLESMPSSQRHRLFEKRQQILRILSRDMATLLGNYVEVRHLMSRDLVTVTAGTPVEELRTMMDTKSIRHLLVLDRAGRLLGIISDRDLRYRTADTAANLMTPDPLVVAPEAPILPPITMMLDRHISCLPVVAEGKPLGVLTSTDLMMSLQCTLQILTKLAAELRFPVRRRQPAASSVEEDVPTEDLPAALTR